MLVVVGWWFYDLHFHWNALPDYSFGWIVMALIAFLVWERWATRPGHDRPVSFKVACLLVGMGLPLVVVAELYKNAIGITPSSSMALSLGSLCFISAMLLHGRGIATWKYYLFPLLFTLIAVPIPKLLWNPVVLGLQGLVTGLNVEALNLLGIPAFRHGSVIQLPNCKVGVDEACSGVRSLQSSVMAGLFLGYLVLQRTSSRCALVGLAVALALLGNVIRSLYLSLTAYRHGLPALEGVHDTTGWSVLLMTAMVLGLVAWWAARLEGRGRERSGGKSANGAARPEAQGRS